ncbi:MAG: hypothetical protein AABZ94_08140 [Candidatus Eisenbacteria bacterium]
MALPTLESLSTLFNVLALVFTGLTVVSGGFALFFALKVGAIKNAEAAQLRIDLSKQLEMTANAEKSLLELQERTRRRTLSAEQRAHLVSSLKGQPNPGLEVWSQLGDTEATSFAEQFTVVFFEIGWGRQMAILDHTDEPKGVTVRMHSKEKSPSAVALFVRAVEEIGVPVAVEYDATDPRLGDYRAYLIVGSKLPP